MLMVVPEAPQALCEALANRAVVHARYLAPKLSGRAADSIYPIVILGGFGVGWTKPYLWYQDQGVRPFTMKSLSGKTIPMWVNDPDGKLKRENPKIETRPGGPFGEQVLIFRRAAPIGAQKTVTKKGAGGKLIKTRVDASFPGAAGRIAVREAASPLTTPGRVGGRIAAGNVGVRWRFPGLAPRHFLYEALSRTVGEAGLEVGQVKVGYDFGAPSNA